MLTEVHKERDKTQQVMVVDKGLNSQITGFCFSEFLILSSVSFFSPLGAVFCSENTIIDTVVHLWNVSSVVSPMVTTTFKVNTYILQSIPSEIHSYITG